LLTYSQKPISSEKKRKKNGKKHFGAF